MQQEASIEIDRPIHDVFDYTNNNVAEWSLTVVEDVPIDTIDNGNVGSTFRCVTEDHGQKMEFAGTVTKWEPPTLSAVRLVGKQFDIDALYTFEDLGERTRVTQISVVHAKTLFMKVMFFFVGLFATKSGCAATMKELQSLKQKIEDSTGRCSRKP
jgi:hypothetical protein